MPPNNDSKPNGRITLKQVTALVGILMLLGMGFGYTTTKADKSELEKTEARVEKKVDKLQEAIKEDIQEIKLKQDKIYDLLVGGMVGPR